MDHLFVVLPKQKSQTPGASPRPRGGGVRQETSPSGPFVEWALAPCIKPVENIRIVAEYSFYAAKPLC
ncbi:hypothetical protein BVRB_2g025500 [Beta vulgaris subsp. vulgaris]|nr:hypothetical protein BVRB_2g025500 [Beta vulgaris subsp. vulgaris]